MDKSFIFTIGMNLKDIFLEIGKIVFGESKEIVDELKNIDAMD